MTAIVVAQVLMSAYVTCEGFSNLQKRNEAAGNAAHKSSWKQTRMTFFTGGLCLYQTLHALLGSAVKVKDDIASLDQSLAHGFACPEFCTKQTHEATCRHSPLKCMCPHARANPRLSAFFKASSQLSSVLTLQSGRLGENWS